MAYDEDLAERIRGLLGGEPGVSERRMFGGLAFLVGGHMAVAAGGEGSLMVRVGPGEAGAVLAEPGARPLEMRGRPLDGWVRVDADGLGTRRELEAWVRRGAGYARSLPPKG